MAPGHEGDGERRLWYKDAIVYEVHVRAFYDSNGDGVGDFPGLTQKLDYIQALGVTAVWLLPFYPSPLKDDGYDIADYQGIHPDYGTLDDFRVFLAEAHKRGLKVITELVLNHTSDQHPWFQRARHCASGSPERNFYVWSDRDDDYQGARVIFQDYELSNWTWDRVAGAYFWHRFYSHQPDLNYGNPQVFEAILGVVDFWLDMGVDGLRLDAVPYLAEAEGTPSENLPETHAILKQIRKHVDERFFGRMLLAEANQWPEDAVAYFGAGDECQMAFHFPLMPRLFMSLRREDSFPIIDILSQTPDIPDNCQWALFLRNHDELTLEMVTEEERLYMWRAYAREPHARINLGIRRRLAPLLGNNRRRMELMNGLLLSMPGTPVLYYGDEIGMGDNIYLGDRNGVRTPMQWGTGRNAGFSDAHPQRLYLPLIIDPEYHYATVHVEAQEHNSYSLLKWMRRVLDLRKRHPAFGRGTMEFLKTGNSRTLAFIRTQGSEIILVVANLSRFTQHLDLDLSLYAGRAPVDLFGRTPFPSIGSDQYPLMLGPHAFHWFSIEEIPEKTALCSQAEGSLPRLVVDSAWTQVMQGEARAHLEGVLPAYIRAQAWYQGTGKQVLACHLRNIISIGRESEDYYLTLVEVEYSSGDPDLYAVPLAYTEGDAGANLQRQSGHAVIAHVAFTSSPGARGLLYDAACEPRFIHELIAAMVDGQRVGTTDGSLVTTAVSDVPFDLEGAPDTITCFKPESANSLAALGKVAWLKLFRRVDEGVNPDVEMGCFLTAQQYRHAPRVFASLQYPGTQREPVTLAVLQEYVENQGTAWDYTLAQVTGYFARAVGSNSLMEVLPLTPDAILADIDAEVPPGAVELIGPYLDAIKLLGKRTGQLHGLLASEREHPTFAPEPFTELYQRSLYQHLRGRTLATFEQLENAWTGLEPRTQRAARDLLKRREQILHQYQPLTTVRINGWRIRSHGNCSLREVLRTDEDFAVIDFEGDASQPVYWRRLKAHPLTDVLSLMRSLFSASQVAFLSEGPGNQRWGMSRAQVLPSVRFWQHWVAVSLLKAYRAAVEEPRLFPVPQDLAVLFPALLTAATVHELAHTLTYQRNYAGIPLGDLLELVGEQEM
jgi:maltose alpha-D-glucosyltransferase / alpha-amylase